MTKEKEHKKIKFCPECGKHMKQNNKEIWFCPECGYKHEKIEKVIIKKEKSIVSSICGGLIILFIILFFIGSFMEDSETKTQQQQPKVYIETSYQELKDIFRSGSKYTDIQKDKIWDEQYKGKYIKWSGKIRDIDTSMLDNLRLYVNIKESIILDDYVVVYVNDYEYDKLIKLNKDDEITFSGKFDSYVTLLGVTFYFKDGEII